MDSSSTSQARMAPFKSLRPSPSNRTFSGVTRPSPKIDIRPLLTHDELRACVELQRETWGAAFSDVVPASILKVSQRIGGVAAGAFAEDGRMLGFVYGMTGVERGRLVHWSDMLAVRPEARDFGLGRKLKDYQRRQILAMGVEIMYWTYDPLVSRNAHLNFNVLGAHAVEYVQDMYGNTDSELHRGIGTDRFIVGWPTSDADVRTRIAIVSNVIADPARRSAPVLNKDPESADAPPAGDGAPVPDCVRIAIPLDLYDLLQTNPSLAERWRASTRAAFLRTVCREHDVDGFFVDEKAARGYYLLSKRR